MGDTKSTGGEAPESTDARNKIEDLSRIEIRPGQNPYEALITTCRNDPAQIQALYDAHRSKRNEQQKEKLLSPEYSGLIIDQYLLRLENPEIEPGFKDERNCLVIWARPPNHIIELAAKIQSILQKTAPDIWLMPTHRMHMTTLEVSFSRTPAEIAALVSTIRPSIPAITNYTYTHRARLVKPQVSYDLTAFALSFLPAAGEPQTSPPPAPLDAPAGAGVLQGDGYTYHHLRRDVFDLTHAAGAEVASRYQVPSAHVTLGRYLGQDGHRTEAQRRAWVAAIEEANRWLEAEVWGRADGGFVGEWVVGQERGLDARAGALWYGGGRTINLGEGF